jgi:hypothetical protein
MPRTFTRRELYELVWSEPMQKLAGRFKLSDVGLANACKSADIPRPPRGYWAKLAAGKKVRREPLPVRQPGMSDVIAPGSGGFFHGYVSEEEILSSDPKPPVFEEDMEEIARRVTAMIPPVTVPRFPERAHTQIRRLLDADEVRRRKQLNDPFPLSFQAPRFDDTFERRRLRMLNALATALERAGMKPAVSGREARDLSVRVHDTIVRYTLDATTQKPDRWGQVSIASRGPSSKLKLVIISCASGRSWEETEKEKFENFLTEIVAELIVTAERQYRENTQRRYEWMLERKAEVIEEVRRRREEAERKERERLAALEKARLDRLLQDAANYHLARDIRGFVAEVEARAAGGEVTASAVDIAAWRTWALRQADRIDPVRSGRFLVSMRDDGEAETEGL